MIRNPIVESESKKMKNKNQFPDDSFEVMGGLRKYWCL